MAKMEKKGTEKILVKDLNSLITCRLCEGYLIDATSLTECVHVFCRACILRHFENTKTGCPTCNTVYKKKSQTCFRADPQTQALVYKLVPSLFAKESQRREDFYRSTGVRASSSCSDDSVIERERDIMNDQEEMIISNVFGGKTQFLSPEDLISLSLEYYQSHLDTTDTEEPTKTVPNEIVKKPDVNNSENTVIENKEKDSDSVVYAKDPGKTEEEENNKCDKRFLQCPAAVSMKHLQKFIRMKFGLTGNHKVDIIYKGEVLKNDFTLMDVAYTFNWKKEKPMRFFYRIFTPLKIRPIKIVNTTLFGGGKQLQIVPVKSTSESQRSPVPKEEKEKVEKPEVKSTFLEETEDQKNHKERLFAHLQLQRTQAEKESKKVPEKPQSKDCVFEYEEPDQEEIKRFAEIRDREWAKKLDEERRKREAEEYSAHHFSKKRKKSKHSKNEFNSHKKRKLHAEIFEEDLKLKVKITNNGHKHKHHKSSVQFAEKDKLNAEMSSKEKLLQMRQVRHKHITSEDKNIQTVPSLILSKDTRQETIKNEEDKPEDQKNPVTEDTNKKLKIKVAEPSSKVSESASLPKQPTEPTSTSPKVGTFLESSSPNTGFTIKSPAEKEWGKKVPTVHLERNEQTEKQAFLKAFHAYAEKYHNEKNQQNKLKNAKKLSMEKSQLKTDNNKITTNNKSLNFKLANLQQRCTIEQKQPEKIEKNNKLVTHYPPGFTVSKIEQGVKRKAEETDNINDKRPSLEITLINPNSGNPIQLTPKPLDKLPVKRPPPATIPLEKIKKSVNLKSGISIIPKMPERCDNNAPLDLSNKSPESSPRNSPKIETTNGLTITSNRQLNALIKPGDKNNVALSNLQMLSKVATEQTNLNNKPQITPSKPRAQMPNLQTLKIPSLQNSIQMKTPNLQKLPKLNEIQKFRPTGQIKNVRPNQNQNIRNIPNPSLLINRQQIQNRIGIGNSIEAPKTVNGDSTASSSTISTTTNNSVKAIDNKIQEKKEISV